jgi:hypothetical protein
MSNYPKTMKALAACGKTDYRYEPARPSPECGDDDIIIKTEGCGICAGGGPAGAAGLGLFDSNECKRQAVTMA